MTPYPARLIRMSVWMYVANLGDSALKPSQASFSVVISDVIVDPTGMNVLVKLGDSCSNGSRDMRQSYFVTNDDAGRRSI